MNFITDYRVEDYILQTRWEDFPQAVKDRALVCGVDLMMALILGGYQFVQSNLMTLAADLHYGRTVGSLAGLGGAAAVLGTILAMIIVPMITRAGWAPFFVFGGLLFPISLLAVFLFGGRIQNIDEEKQQ